jgi:hypothetical protein
VAQVPVSEGHGLRLALALQTDPLPLMTQLNRDHGPIVRLRVPRRPVFLVSDPEAIQDAFQRTHHGYEKGCGRSGDLRPAAGPPPVRPRAQVTLHPRDGVWLSASPVTCG